MESLFRGTQLRLATFNPERDAEAESRWTHDADYLRQLDGAVAWPLSPTLVKKRHEKLTERFGFGKPLYYFVLRTLEDDRPVGFVMLHWVEVNHHVARMQVGIGSAADRERGYAAEALRLGLRYAFEELNLRRVTVVTSEYAPEQVRLLERAGMTLEARRREAWQRDGRYWDVLHYGMLDREWYARRDAEAVPAEVEQLAAVQASAAGSHAAVA